MPLRFFLYLLFCGFGMQACNERDIISIRSNSMHEHRPCLVIQPSTVSGDTAWPVIYLLHGYQGHYADWEKRVPALQRYANEFQVILVCPDGYKSGWYIDSPLDSTMRYETYMAKEVVDYIDTHYPGIHDRKARAITGLSMGGHGALYLAFRHADTFGSCGSISGITDLRPFRTKFELTERLGDSSRYPGNWKDFSVINVIEQKPSDSIAILLDCGSKDYAYEVNKQLHEKMVKLNIKHDYLERPGEHNWSYWKEAIKYQLQFFSDYFKKNGY